MRFTCKRTPGLKVWTGDRIIKFHRGVLETDNPQHIRLLQQKAVSNGIEWEEGASASDEGAKSDNPLLGCEGRPTDAQLKRANRGQLDEFARELGYTDAELADFDTNRELAEDLIKQLEARARAAEAARQGAQGGDKADDGDQTGKDPGEGGEGGEKADDGDQTGDGSGEEAKGAADGSAEAPNPDGDGDKA